MFLFGLFSVDELILAVAEVVVESLFIVGVLFDFGMKLEDPETMEFWETSLFLDCCWELDSEVGDAPLTEIFKFTNLKPTILIEEAQINIVTNLSQQG